jgi:hypothetical protein
MDACAGGAYAANQHISVVGVEQRRGGAICQRACATVIVSDATTARDGELTFEQGDGALRQGSRGTVVEGMPAETETGTTAANAARSDKNFVFMILEVGCFRN